MYSSKNIDVINQSQNGSTVKDNVLESNIIDHINKLSEIGLSLSNIENIDNIFDLILVEAMLLTDADGATYYSLSTCGRYLNYTIMRTKSLNIIKGGSHGIIDMSPIPLFKEDNSKNTDNLSAAVFHTKKMYVFDDYYSQNSFSPLGAKKFDLAFKYRTKSMVAIPLINHEHQVIGIIQLINSVDKKTKEVKSFNTKSLNVVRSLAVQAAVALTNKQLIHSYERLFLQFVKTVALALDKKSPHTGGHISKVAKVTKMIANQVNQTKTGYFASYSFSKDEMNELNASAWLHDVGKIATPDCIMNKATKLSDNDGRIDLIFSKYQTIIALYDNPHYALKAYERKENFDYLNKNAISFDTYTTEIKNKLTSDFDFIRNININFDYILDNNSNRIINIAKVCFLSQNKQYKWLENEDVDNLLIKRGNLNKSERNIMNAHVKNTYQILKQLTYPQKYEKIPFYAASHHEKLDGSGYPWKLTAEKLPLQSRIIAIADIFEALTASDRPYKHGKKLSEAMQILAICAKRNQIDKNLFELILDNKIYEKYAKRYLKTNQIDEVDTNYLKDLIK